MGHNDLGSSGGFYGVLWYSMMPLVVLFTCAGVLDGSFSGLLDHVLKCIYSCPYCTPEVSRSESCIYLYLLKNLFEI